MIFQPHLCLIQCSTLSLSVVMENKDYSTYPGVGDREARVGDIVAFKMVELGGGLRSNSAMFKLVNNGYKRKHGKFQIDDYHVEKQKISKKS